MPLGFLQRLLPPIWRKGKRAGISETTLRTQRLTRLSQLPVPLPPCQHQDEAPAEHPSSPASQEC